MSLLGPQGLAKVASASIANTTALVAALAKVPGVEIVFTSPRFHEAVIRLPKPVAPVLEKLADANIGGGFDLTPYYPELGHALLVCATETKTAKLIQTYADALAAALK